MMKILLKTIPVLLLCCACGCSPAAQHKNGTDPGTDTGRKEAWTVRAKETPDSEWKEYRALATDCLEGFKPGTQPETDKYGGWKTRTLDATGFFRVEKVDGRWYLVTPEGHPMLSAQVGAFGPGDSERQKKALASVFGTTQRWAASEMYWLRSKGFTGVAGSTNTVRTVNDRIAYNVFMNPMTTYVRELRNTYKVPSNMPVVFGDGYTEALSNSVSWLDKYASDPFCLGVTTDDELFWTDDMLKYYLSAFPVSDPNRVAAQTWLDQRLGRSNCTIAAASEEDKQAFKVYCLEAYLSKTSAAVHAAAPGIMYLGPRYYKWIWELSSPEMMAVAGKYTDIICVNHFTKWEPSQEDLANWSQWSGRPVMITSFDVKGEDSGLPNNAGLGWIVPTQEDRGKFYENFVLALLRSRCCVGWQWYTYQDNDPEDETSDASNRDSNKGLVTWDFKRYDDMLKRMSAINGQLNALVDYYDK